MRSQILPVFELHIEVRQNIVNFKKKVFSQWFFLQDSSGIRLIDLFHVI